MELESGTPPVRARVVRRFGMASIAIVLGLAPVAMLATTAHADDAFHGITVQKSCNATTPVLSPLLCSYRITNSDDNSESVTIASLNDKVHAAGGDVNSGNILFSLSWTPSGGAVCSAGTCTLPTLNSKIQSAKFSFYNVVGADYNLPSHILDDTVTVHWSEPSCAHGGCPIGDQLSTTGASTIVTKTQPTILTQLSQIGSVPQGTSVTDQAVINDAAGTAQGTVSYAVYSDVECSQLVKNLGTKEVDGTVGPSDPFVANTPGNFWFQASYSGDDANLAGKSACETEPLSVTATTTTTTTTTTSTTTTTLPTTVSTEGTTVTTQAAATESPSTVAAQAELPKTGSSSGPGLAVGTILLLGGGALVGSQRYRRRTRP